MFPEFIYEVHSLLPFTNNFHLQDPGHKKWGEKYGLVFRKWRENGSRVKEKILH